MGERSMPMTERKQRQPHRLAPPPEPGRDEPPSPVGPGPDQTTPPAPSDGVDAERAAEEVAERDHPLN